MATAINKTRDSEKYLSIHAKISDAFVKAFVNETDAKILGDTQTVYLLALAFEMLPKSLRALAANHLVDNIKAHNWHLTTGFVGLIQIMQKTLNAMNFFLLMFWFSHVSDICAQH
jgi:alpha-L-rhamnosidase